MVLKLPERVTITEVGPRDGFQMEERFIPTEKKIEVINRLARAGLKRIEATSFVHPKVIPQLRDAEEVMRGIERVPGVKYRALVPNEFGARRALEVGVDELLVVVHCSETYSRKNINRSIEESLEETERVVQLAESKGIPVAAGLAVAFGCPYEGEVPHERVIGLIERLLRIGVKEISLPDTVGMADPVRIVKLVGQIFKEFPELPMTLHLHDAAGMGLANVLAAMEAGLTHFESSICGLGGSPVNPKAKGNIPTEDLVHMLSQMGVETGIDLEALLECARFVKELVAHEVPSHVLHSGRREDVIRCSKIRSATR
jgi:hydroxymethylglutaryl-CoA lyase